MGLSHFLMTWKAGDSTYTKDHKGKQEYYRWRICGYPRLTRGVDGAEFSPLPEEESPRSSPGGDGR